MLNGQASKYHKIGASVPQGSVIGPILWNIFHNDLLDLIPQAYAFADNCTISVSGTPASMGETLKKLNQTLENIRRWSETWQVTLAPQKNKALHIIKRKMPNDRCLQMAGPPIEFTREMNIFGVNIVSGLTFVNHVREVASRAGRKLACIRRISNMLHAESIRLPYNSQVLPLIKCCSMSWNG